MGDLSHLDKHGNAHMVDVSGKEDTARTATARSTVKMKLSTLNHLKSGDNKKGDVLGTARIAGIMAAKQTSNLIPLCHPLMISTVSIGFEINDEKSEVHVEVTVKTSGKTGVEMEALTAVQVASLTLYDMLKAVDKSMTINNCRLILKEGGKSGRYEAS